MQVGCLLNQGRISIYSVLAESVTHIQETVRFARDNNLRIVVKNTGHCFLGRSSAPGSLQIFTHRLKNITFHDIFTPKGGEKLQKTYSSTVSIGAGVQLNELYDAAHAYGLVIVGGYSTTVGAAGGYIQGGGHSMLGPWKGMASDNVIEFELVTAEGEHLTANEYVNQDLFWALRGGGGGSFGVVTSVTIQAYPDAPLLSADLHIERASADTEFWDAVQVLFSFLPSLNDAGAAGYSAIIPRSGPEKNAVARVETQFIFPNETDVKRIHRVMEPLLQTIISVTRANPELQIQSMKTFYDYFQARFGKGDVTGGGSVIGSRMLSREFLESSTGPTNISTVLSKIELATGEAIMGNFVAGGQVTRNGGHISSALHPSWRRALCHISIVRGWPSNASFVEQKAIQDQVTYVQVPLLKSLEPGQMGAYLNEADPYEPDFQSSFWGENYAKLYTVKRMWDPNGLFITRLGVGSEDWDEEGFCRIGR
ncbi:FAD-dependent oxidoreductase [Aspergillus tanneri]|uniref:FAD-binding PCMH-type domain-containing protein n=1 Tax=Aspergillus tanneri TaxID=1220188 RepID=A0A5M9MU22_9EURO|nr:uncharacterized protein ATNIH1004_004705 [Aspergillus tanneri]KAA8648820.1 hypothetical protein ATNIH1004_004705 [Aspergillus tanneri]